MHLTTALTPYQFDNLPIRVVADAAGDPWFVATDICRGLEIADVTSALRVLDEDEKGPLTVRTLGGDQVVNGVSEPGLYRLLGRSRKPEAKRFDRWVRHEVLPSIRKTGTYRLRDQTTEASLLTTKTDAYDRLLSAEGLYSLGQAAKILGLKPKMLKHNLQGRGWLFKPKGRWQAYQTKIDAGLLVHRACTFPKADKLYASDQVMITPAGLAALVAEPQLALPTPQPKLSAPLPAMPEWLDQARMLLLEGVRRRRRREYNARLSEALGQGVPTEHVRRQFLLSCVDYAVTVARPSGGVSRSWIAVREACDQVLNFLRNSAQSEAATLARQANSTGNRAENLAAWAAFTAQAAVGEGGASVQVCEALEALRWCGYSAANGPTGVTVAYETVFDGLIRSLTEPLKLPSQQT